MKSVSAAIKVGLLFIVLLVGSYAVWKMVGDATSRGSGFRLWAKFKDASGLPVGSRVVVAGLPVGEVDVLAIEGRYAKIFVRLRKEVKVFENAIIFKKSSSLLGDFYLEIDPGTPESVNARGEKVENRELGPEDQVARVVEASTPDQLIRRIEESIPNVDAVLLSVRDLSEDLRTVINGPVASIASRIDRLVQDESDTVGRILQRTDRAIARIEGIAADIKRNTTQGGRVDDILANLDKASQEAKDLVLSARSEVEQTGAKVREKLDLVDEVLDKTASVVGKVDDDKGTLGRLVNDSTLADNLEDITEDAKGFLGTLFGMQTYVGLRGEYGVASGLSRFYVTLELRTRPDKFYYIEFEKGPRGPSDIALVYDPTLGRYRQEVRIEDKLRFTFQFARKIDWLTLRYGIKESSGGVGVDTNWFNNRLTVSADVFEASFDKLPRVKVSAAYQFFGYLYVLGGLDDILNAPDELIVDATDPGSSTANGSEVPQQFRSYRFGRDWFLGAMIKFNDLDLTALLAVGGAALLGAVD